MGPLNLMKNIVFTRQNCYKNNANYIPSTYNNINRIFN